VNHFNSKGGDQGLFGPSQPPVLSSEVQRNQQATLLAGFVGDILALDPTANVAVIGDLNDFQFSPPVQKLKDAGLTPLIETLPPAERYSYVFDGNSQALDHIMVSSNLRNTALAAAGFDIVHVNSEFIDQASDHDPQLVQLTMPTYSSLCTLTRSYVDDQSVADSLCAKLADAEAAAAAGNEKTKNNIIAAYVRHVRAQIGKSLTAAEAAILIALAKGL
jgi:uncharacterized protein